MEEKTKPFKNWNLKYLQLIIVIQNPVIFHFMDMKIFRNKDRN
jgi:hypothetical protein